MKFVKMSFLALSLGLFAASCGNSNGEAAKTDSVAAPAATETTPAPAAPVDSMSAPKTDTPAAAPADNKMEEKK